MSIRIYCENINKLVIILRRLSDDPRSGFQSLAIRVTDLISIIPTRHATEKPNMDKTTPRGRSGINLESLSSSKNSLRDSGGKQQLFGPSSSGNTQTEEWIIRIYEYAEHN